MVDIKQYNLIVGIFICLIVIGVSLLVIIYDELEDKSDNVIPDNNPSLFNNTCVFMNSSHENIICMINEKIIRCSFVMNDTVKCKLQEGIFFYDE